MTQQVRPFTVDIAQPKLAHILSKLQAADFSYAPDDDAGWKYGADVAYLREFVDYWLHRFDWPAAQGRLNRWPQFKAQVDDIDVHFYWIKSAAPNALPLILTHGWPGSVFEFHKIIDALTTAPQHGATGVAFDVVIPSLPGYGFSSRPARPIGPRRVAALWAKLMTGVLGYGRFVAQGGDWGCAVTTWLGSDFPDSLLAVHQNLCVTPMGGPPADDEERRWRESYRKVRNAESAYMMQHMTKPQTIGIALSDSPLGFAAWVLEKFHRWGDTHGNIESRFSKDDLITNILLYLATDTVTSSIWMYHGAILEMLAGQHATFNVRCPTALALFPAEFLPWPPRRTIERFYNVQRWTQMAAGGHFAALEEPKLLIEDLREFCGTLRG